MHPRKTTRLAIFKNLGAPGMLRDLLFLRAYVIKNILVRGVRPNQIHTKEATTGFNGNLSQLQNKHHDGMFAAHAFLTPFEFPLTNTKSNAEIP